MSLANDLAAIFADASLTVSVTYGASPTQSTRGFLLSEDLPEPDSMGGITMVSRRIVTVQDTALTGLAKNTTITVDGTTYRIHDLRAGGRGKTKVVLA